MTDGDRPTAAETYTYDLDPGESLSQGVIAAVSAVTGVAPVGSWPKDAEGVPALDPLYDAIDPDALDSLFANPADGSTRPGGRVTFTYHGHRVSARGDGRVIVERPVPPERVAD